MKRFLLLTITIILFALAAALGLKNQQLVNVNYLIAQNELRLSTLLAIIFMFGFLLSACFAFLFHLKQRYINNRLRKANKKQRKELNELRSTPEKV